MHFVNISARKIVPALLCAACARSEPPTWSALGASESVAPMPAAMPPASTLSPAGERRDGGPTDAAASPIGQEDAGGLPQTHDRPKPQGPFFESGATAWFDAIVQDDPVRAEVFFFPAAAYAQVKAIANPYADHKRRLLANFARDVHLAHAKLGKNAVKASFKSLDVPTERARWVEPGEEGNKLGYFRVYGSKLRYEVDGKPLSLEVSSLISWRGEWYVVHLSGFK